MTARTCLLVAALSGGLAVTLGAFGAHGLNDTKYLERKYADLPAKTVAARSRDGRRWMRRPQAIRAAVWVNW